MRRSYSKWSSIALIAAIYLFATVVGIVVYFAVNRVPILDFTASRTNSGLYSLFSANHCLADSGCGSNDCGMGIRAVVRKRVRL